MEGKDHVQIQGSELKHQRPLITELPDIKAVQLVNIKLAYMD